MSERKRQRPIAYLQLRDKQNDLEHWDCEDLKELLKENEWNSDEGENGDVAVGLRSVDSEGLAGGATRAANQYKMVFIHHLSSLQLIHMFSRYKCYQAHLLAQTRNTPPADQLRSPRSDRTK